MIFRHSELPWQQNVSRLSIQYQIERDEEREKEHEHLDRITVVNETKMREAARQKKAEDRAAVAKKSRCDNVCMLYMTEKSGHWVQCDTCKS